MSATTPRPPFWTPKPTSQRLRGSYTELLEAAAQGDAVIPVYRQGAAYELGGLVDHKNFGVGVVVELPALGRMTVRFADADRLLVCAR